MNTPLRILYIFLLIAMPFLTFGVAVFLNLVKINFFVIGAILFLGLPFWFLFVLPITLLFKLKNSIHILYLILVIAVLLTGWYLISSWTTDSNGLIIGNKIYIENGVPTTLYYTSTLIDSSLIFLTIIFGSIFFIKLIEN